jgi:hypothetical protein
MANYWVIAAYEQKDDRGKTFDEIWDYDLKHGVVGLGASSLQKANIDNIPMLSKEELEEEIRRLNPDWTSQKVKSKARAIWQFHNEIKEGDYLIVKDGKKIVLAIGRVVSRDGRVTFYDRLRGFERAGNPGNPYPNFVNVDWKKTEPIHFEEDVFLIGRFKLLQKILTTVGKTKYLPQIIKECE